jgi:hypothetical protein
LEAAMTNQFDEETLTVLACELDARPKEAPRLDDVLPLVRGVVRDAGVLVLSFDKTALPTIVAFAAAERLCCAELDWQVDVTSGELRIGAAPAQLDALQAMFDPQVS